MKAFLKDCVQNVKTHSSWSVYHLTARRCAGIMGSSTCFLDADPVQHGCAREQRGYDGVVVGGLLETGFSH